MWRSPRHGWASPPTAWTCWGWGTELPRPLLEPKPVRRKSYTEQ
uniref:Uncharacterized protein n=1 Tax=Chelonoidis abingdonii TaxID=106734 RepID=A0A8C0JAY7_CHEAB